MWQAEQNMNKAEYEEACRKYEAAERLQLKDLFATQNLARCHEKRGMTATAWREYLRLAEEDGTESRRKHARDQASRLEENLSRIRVSLAGASPPGLTITVRGAGRTWPEHGEGVPVDPDQTYDVTVVAPGYERWHWSGSVPRDGLTLTAELHPQVEESKTIVPDPDPPPPPEDPGAGWRRFGVVMACLGSVGTISSIGTLAAARAKHGQSAGHCATNGYCDPTGYDAETQAGRLANATTGLIIAGPLSITLGGFVYGFASEKTKPAAQSRGFRSFVLVGARGASVGGVF
jgi:hypothetical protein